jgi:hypothetical protein
LILFTAAGSAQWLSCLGEKYPATGTSFYFDNAGFGGDSFELHEIYR